MKVGKRKGDERRNIDGLKPVESAAEAAALLLHDLELPGRLAALHAVCVDAERRPSPLSVAQVEAAG